MGQTGKTFVNQSRFLLRRVMTVSDLTHPAAELDERFITGRDAGFSPDTVEDYVANLTGRSVQRR